jgi:hypothetical protein
MSTRHASHVGVNGNDGEERDVDAPCVRSLGVRFGQEKKASGDVDFD